MTLLTVVTMDAYTQIKDEDIYIINNPVPKKRNQDLQLILIFLYNFYKKKKPCTVTYNHL